MALMYDHEIEVLVRVYARSTQSDNVDDREDIQEAIKEDMKNEAQLEILDWDIVHSEAGDY
jgi:hypothetical protein|tara:strand:- start:194 stop:376 length:183 start_codon:yes stop_codon:yes gene_type:complete